VRVGLAFLPVALAIGTLSLGFSARLNTRFGARAVLLTGLAVVAPGLALLTRIPVHGRYTIDLLPAMLLVGLGAGLAFPAIMTLGMSDTTPEDSGLASGLVNTTQQIGGALGLAILAATATAHTGALMAAGQPPASAQTDGYRLAFTLSTALVLAAVLVAATTLRPPPALVPTEQAPAVAAA
jgi:MFS family permease